MVYVAARMPKTAQSQSTKLRVIGYLLNTSKRIVPSHVVYAMGMQLNQVIPFAYLLMNISIFIHICLNRLNHKQFISFNISDCTKENKDLAGYVGGSPQSYNCAFDAETVCLKGIYCIGYIAIHSILYFSIDILHKHSILC